MASTVQRPWQEKGLVPAIWTGLFLLLLMPLVVTPSTLFPFVVGKATYTRGLIEILFVLWVLLAVASPRYRLGTSWVLAIFALYVVVNAASALVGVSFERSFWGDYRRMGGVFDLVHWFVLLLILASMVKTTSHWRWLLNANLGVGFVLGLLGLAQHYDVDVFQSLFWYFETKQRLDITFGNPTYVGAYMLVNVLMAMAFLADSVVRPSAPRQQPRHRRRRREARQDVPYQLWALRAFWLMVIPLNLFVMTLSGTRGAVVGLGAALLLAGAVYALWGSRKRVRVAAGVATAVLLLLTIGFPILQESALYHNLASNNEALERLGTVSLQSGSGRARVITARIGLEAFASKPILGWGPENFIFAFQRHVKLSDFPNPLLGDQAHNRVVNELTSTGLMGFAVYMLLWGRIGWVVFRKVRAEPGEDVLTVGLAAALAGYFVQNLFLFDVHATFLQAALLTGWVASTEVNLRASRGGHINTSKGSANRTGSLYEAFGLSQGASQAEINSAYHRLVQKYHPDKVADMAPELRDLAEQRMKELNAAYEQLKQLTTRNPAAVSRNPAESRQPEATRPPSRHRQMAHGGSESWATGILAWFKANTARAAARWTGVILLVFFLMASLWFVIGPSYRAAQHFPTQVVGWDELWAKARRSFQTFPPMATLPRQVLFDTLVDNWDEISAVGVPEIVDKVQPEELAALESDPKNSLLYLALGELYQKAAETHPQYIERAGKYVATARELAPEATETLVLMVSQAMLEKDYQRALDIIEEYDYGYGYQFIYEVDEIQELAKQLLRSEEGESNR